MPNRDDTPHRGTGYWWINTGELLLTATRGDVPAPLMGRKLNPSSPRTSAGILRSLQFFGRSSSDTSPNVGRIELFARKAVPGWDAWGNEVANGVRA
jgi:N6-adenosine-specific RNA methylase IME4